MVLWNGAIKRTGFVYCVRSVLRRCNMTLWNVVEFVVKRRCCCGN